MKRRALKEQPGTLTAEFFIWQCDAMIAKHRQSVETFERWRVVSPGLYRMQGLTCIANSESEIAKAEALRALLMELVELRKQAVK